MVRALLPTVRGAVRSTDRTRTAAYQFAEPTVDYYGTGLLP